MAGVASLTCEVSVPFAVPAPEKEPGSAELDCIMAASIACNNVSSATVFLRAGTGNHTQKS